MADQWSGGQRDPNAPWGGDPASAGPGGQWGGGPWGGQSGPGERWNVNLPAVIGVVFVFLVGVIVWVIATSDDDGDGELSIGSSVPSTSTASSPSIQTTTPLPMPSTTVLPPTLPPTAPPSSLATAPPTSPATAPPSAAPTAAPTAAPPPPTQAPAPPPPTQAPTTAASLPPAQNGGDLGVPGHPIARPPCNGGYITVVASAIGSQATPASMDAVLDRYSGSSYLRTDQTCSSLNPSANGQPIYVVFFGPFATDAEACAARADGPEDAYVRRLSNDLTPNHTVNCT